MADRDTDTLIDASAVPLDHQRNEATQATLTASGSGSDFIDTCYYVPGGDGSGACVEPAQTFLDDVSALVDATSTWEL